MPKIVNSTTNAKSIQFSSNGVRIRKKRVQQKLVVVANLNTRRLTTIGSRPEHLRKRQRLIFEVNFVSGENSSEQLGFGEDTNRLLSVIKREHRLDGHVVSVHGPPKSNLRVENNKSIVENGKVVFGDLRFLDSTEKRAKTDLYIEIAAGNLFDRPLMFHYPKAIKITADGPRNRKSNPRRMSCDISAPLTPSSVVEVPMSTSSNGSPSPPSVERPLSPPSSISSSNDSTDNEEFSVSPSPPSERLEPSPNTVASPEYLVPQQDNSTFEMFIRYYQEYYNSRRVESENERISEMYKSGCYQFCQELSDFKRELQLRNPNGALSPALIDEIVEKFCPELFKIYLRHNRF